MRCAGWTQRSTIFAPRLKDAVRGHLGWPVLAVAPARDFPYLFSEQSQEALVPRLGGVVRRELDGSPWPVTPEVLRLSDEGVTAIGAYPAAPGQ